MNRISSTLLAAATLLAVFATATAPTDVRAQTTQNRGQRTTFAITLTVERQEVVAGPYARYAQKYLGVAAPLADKVLHRVKSAELLDSGDAPQSKETLFPAYATEEYAVYTHMNPARGFPRLTVDKTSAATTSLEESARLAAEKIFTIRRSRFDLITGEVGENVFGGGLYSALAEMNRLEEEYLSLFLGRVTVGSERREYGVTPVRGRLSYTVCRFSETDGLLPPDDLSGVPVVLELQAAAGDPPGDAAPNAPARPGPRAVAQLVPADMTGRLILEGAELASGQFRILQMGETVYVNP
ncbi:MAG: DUF4831 family protein [Alistipes sp.]|jgi:hypothetical protein|nr:DUF4831 family protein [Alistipes sp.]